MGTTQFNKCQLISSFLSFFLGWGISHWNLGLHDLSRLVGLQVTWVFLSLPSQRWDFKCVSTGLAFLTWTED